MQMKVLDHHSHGVTRNENPRGNRSSESGYALLMALFLMVVMIIASGAALQNIVTQGRRQRETELIWRGDQWVRAIRFYYRKKGYYPQTADTLKSGVPGVHFLRLAAYKDPMNSANDDSWRFIYVNSAGQITGSVRYASLQQMALMDLNGVQGSGVQAGASPGVPASSMASNNSDSTSTNSSGTNNQTTAEGQAVNPLLLLKPTGPVDGPVMGAFLTGVGSGAKTDRDSIRVYHGGKKYKEWEFIWNPLEDQAQTLRQTLNNPGAPAGQPGQPIGTDGTGNENPPGPAGPASPSQPSPTEPTQ
jgi:hypothetical protein